VKTNWTAKNHATGVQKDTERFEALEDIKEMSSYVARREFNKLGREEKNAVWGILLSYDRKIILGNPTQTNLMRNAYLSKDQIRVSVLEAVYERENREQIIERLVKKSLENNIAFPQDSKHTITVSRTDLKIGLVTAMKKEMKEKNLKIVFLLSVVRNSFMNAGHKDIKKEEKNLKKLHEDLKKDIEDNQDVLSGLDCTGSAKEDMKKPDPKAKALMRSGLQGMIKAAKKLRELHQASAKVEPITIRMHMYEAADETGKNGFYELVPELFFPKEPIFENADRDVIFEIGHSSKLTVESGIVQALKEISSGKRKPGYKMIKIDVNLVSNVTIQNNYNGRESFKQLSRILKLSQKIKVLPVEITLGSDGMDLLGLHRTSITFLREAFSLVVDMEEDDHPWSCVYGAVSCQADNTIQKKLETLLNRAPPVD